MLGNVILPPLTSGLGESTCKMTVSSGVDGVADCSGKTPAVDEAIADRPNTVHEILVLGVE